MSEQPRCPECNAWDFTIVDEGEYTCEVCGNFGLFKKPTKTTPPEENKMSDVKEAMAVIAKALGEDKDYMITWYSNLAMLAQDAGADYIPSQHQAAQFIYIFFGLDVSEWRDHCISCYTDKKD